MSGRGEQLPPPPQPPTGAPLALGVDGILEGRVADPAALGAAVEALGACGAGRFRLQITGARFNVLPEETSAPAATFDQDAQAAFVQALRQVIAAAAPASIETTLRCTLVYPDQVAETLFVVRGADLEPLTRRRPRDAGDVPPLLDQAARSPALPRRQLLLFAPLLLVATALLAWQAGWIDRALAAPAADLRTDGGPFGALLRVDTVGRWGDYEVTLRRGDDYPTTPAELARRRDASPDLAARAATVLVGDGGALFVQLRAADGTLLAERRAELRPLLDDAEGAVQVQLPGQMAAHTVRLALASGRAPR